VRLYALAFSLIFMAFGTWSVYLGARSWNGHGLRPSESIAYSSGKSPRVRRIVDRCILPLGLLYLSLGITLGLADVNAWHLSTGPVLSTAAGIGAVASVVFLVLTVSACRYWRPRRLIPTYLRHGVERRRPGGASESGD
jgi:hypothetical protein